MQSAPPETSVSLSLSAPLGIASSTGRPQAVFSVDGLTATWHAGGLAAGIRRRALSEGASKG